MFRYSDTVPQLKVLEDNADILVSEFKALKDSQKETDPDYNPIGSWRLFAFHRKDVRNKACCDLCPNTVKLIESLGDVYISGYSSLGAGKTIMRHIDSQDIKSIRVHFPLQVGKGICRFFVEDAQTDWIERKAFCFDPLVSHEGFNHSTLERVILLIDYKKFYDIQR